MLGRDHGLPLNTRDIMVNSENVFERPPGQRGHPQDYFEYWKNVAPSFHGVKTKFTEHTMTSALKVRSELQDSSNSRSIIHCGDGIALHVEVELILTVVWWNTRDIQFRNCIFPKFPDSMEFQSWKANFKTDLVAGDFNGTAWLCGNKNKRQFSRRSFLQSVRYQHRTLHDFGGPESIPNNWADVCWFVKPLVSDRYWTVRMQAFSIPRKTLGLRPTDQSCRHETWLHQDFVDWRNTQSHHGEPDRRIILRERPAPHHQGAKKSRISDIMSDHSISSWTCDHSHAFVTPLRKLVHRHEGTSLMTFRIVWQRCHRRDMFWSRPLCLCFILVCFEHVLVASWRKRILHVAQSESVDLAGALALLRSNILDSFGVNRTPSHVTCSRVSQRSLI